MPADRDKKQRPIFVSPRNKFLKNLQKNPAAPVVAIYHSNGVSAGATTRDEDDRRVLKSGVNFPGLTVRPYRPVEIERDLPTKTAVGETAPLLGPKAKELGIERVLPDEKFQPTLNQEPYTVALENLKKNIEQLNDLQSRLSLMLKEIEDLVD